VSLPIIRGVSQALYPFTQRIAFRTIVGQWQNGTQQRSVAQPGALIAFELPYANLSQAEKNTVKAAVDAAAGQSNTTLSVTFGGGVTFTNLSLDSDEFAGTESKTTQYAAPLKVSQVLTQNLFPGSPGAAFPALANGAMSVLPYTQTKRYQTVATKLAAGPKWTTPEFAGAFANYPTDGLMAWTLDERGLTDADRDTRIAHFLANWGACYTFTFVDEDSTSHPKTRYASDTLVIRYNDVNNSDIRIELVETY
jgi:hypothetical protein